MFRNPTTVCLRCRLALTAKTAQKRFRTKQAFVPKPQPRRPAYSPRLRLHPSPFAQASSSLEQTKSAPPEDITPETCSVYFGNHVKHWSADIRTLQRFHRFGFPVEDMKPILAAYAQAGSSGFFSTPTNQVKYQLARFADQPSASAPQLKAMARQAEAQIIFSNIFFAWCLHSVDSAILDSLASEGNINPDTLASLRHLAQVASRRPAEEFPYARMMQRKVIMHVGPTNSGKTHHALRALAAAKSGVYAGPLRLLAHEIWERLNLGQIVPLGVDQPPPNLDSSSSPIKSTPQVVKPTNPSYARKTNMITGEEKKIVDDSAGILSCTVEMLSQRAQYDIGVIDEIQMIGDPQRGFAWTSALLGLCAKELHLCGEASAIPIVEKLLQETGDDLEVRVYERLTPLNVEEKSLDGDYGRVVKGDCVVAFSRSRIFEIKDEIERKSGLRCAVVYGKLPPEIRSEQAALFNDPNSGFDVIIGSDAIGMGLNLKIRRIIFDSVSKGDGSSHRKTLLSISQTKQIAGRAGRYGHSIDTSTPPGGYTTTLYAKDLPFLKDAVSHPTTPTLTHAYIGPTVDTVSSLTPALPLISSSSSSPPSSSSLSSTTLESIQMAHLYASNLPRVYRYTHTSSPSSLSKIGEICEWIENQSKGILTWSEKHVWLVSPVAWRDELVVGAAEEMIKRQRDEMFVGIEDVVNGTLLHGRRWRGFMSVLEGIERQMKMKKKNDNKIQMRITDEILETLESFHKILVLYMWMHFRNAVVYAEREKTEELKVRVEVGLDWALQAVGRSGSSMRSVVDKLRVETWSGTALDEGREEEKKKGEPSTTTTTRVGGGIRRSENKLTIPPQFSLPLPPPSTSTPNSQQKQKIGYTTTSESGRAPRQWIQPPDLSVLLKRYVDAPSLKVSSSSANQNRVQGK